MDSQVNLFSYRGPGGQFLDLELGGSGFWAFAVKDEFLSLGVQAWAIKFKTSSRLSVLPSP